VVHLDLDAGSAQIRRALSRHRPKEAGEDSEDDRAEECVYEFREPKAGSGRTIPLSPTLVATLRAHRKAQVTYVLKLKIGKHYRRDLDLVFANRLGEPLEERNLEQR
jgi:hypothetical protein